MKSLVFVVLALVACSKKDSGSSAVGSAAAGSAAGSATGSAAAAGSAAPAEPVADVPCKDAAKAYSKKMAAKPGNVLSDAKPDDGLIYFTAISMEDYCDGEDGQVVAWTAAEKACVVKADDPNSCFSGASLSQVNAGLNEVVTSALANKKANDEKAAAEKAAGSAK